MDMEGPTSEMHQCVSDFVAVKERHIESGVGGDTLLDSGNSSPRLLRSSCFLMEIFSFPERVRANPSD